MIKGRITKNELTQELRALMGRASNFKFLMDAFGAYQLAETIKIFKAQGKPKWDRLKAKTIIARFTRGNRERKVKRRLGTPRFTRFFMTAKILIDRGRLWNSINFKGSRFKSEIGTNVVYAATHNFGDKKRKIPEHPFLYFTKENVDTFERMIYRWLEEGKV